MKTIISNNRILFNTLYDSLFITVIHTKYLVLYKYVCEGKFQNNYNTKVDIITIISKDIRYLILSQERFYTINAICSRIPPTKN